MINLTVSIQVNATLTRIWEILTRYDLLTEFVPGVETSLVVQQDGPVKLVEQAVSARVMGFPLRARVTLEVTETPLQGLYVRSLGGDFPTYQGQWIVEPQADGSSRIEYEAIINPRLPVPVLGLSRQIQQVMQHHMAALKQHMEAVPA